MKYLTFIIPLIFLLSCTHPATRFLQNNPHVNKDVLIMRYGQPDETIKLEESTVYIWDNKNGMNENKLKGYKLKAGFQNSNGKMVYWEVCKEC